MHWVQVGSSGVEGYLAAPELRESEIVLTNAKIIQGPEIADHALALLAALESGKLAGAGLDVTEPEPLPPDHALWKRDDVILTPHIAGRSDGFSERRIGLFRENIERFVRGQPLRNVVDKQRGY